MEFSQIGKIRHRSSNYAQQEKHNNRQFIVKQWFKFKDLLSTSNLVYVYFTKRKILVKSGDIELNPGPGKTTIAVNSYNCRGLKDRLKLKRIFNSCYKLINQNRNTIFCLQETHLELSDVNVIDLMWRHSYVLSPGTARQCGTFTLFDPSWELVKTVNDNEGRMCFSVLEKFDLTFIIANIYAPNDHNQRFFTEAYNTIINLQTEYVGSKVIVAGDFNLVLGEGDSLNRAVTRGELQSRRLLLEQNTVVNLVDMYRVKNVTGGYTWARGDCMSRLDMIFASRDLSNGEVYTNIDWAFDNSDHSRLEISFDLDCEIVRGPGLIRINCEVLENREYVSKLKEN
jgi:exonuclease III